MTTSNNPHAVNKGITGLAREMTPGCAKPHRDTDTLFVGVWNVTAADMVAINSFGLSKNYKIVLATFARDEADGPTAYDVFVNDGVNEFAILQNGRLWKRNANSAAVLLFDDIKAMIRLSTKGRLLVREMAGEYHEFGYELAAAALRSRAARATGGTAVISTIGTMPVVLEMKAFASMFAAAA